jgi:hypothetical protein
MFKILFRGLYSFWSVEIVQDFHRPKLKEHMQYFTEHPDEVNRISKVKATLSDVKGIVIENIEKVFIQLLWHFILSL